MVVYPINRRFKLKIGEVLFTFNQLSYLDKNIIANKANREKNGVPVVDYIIESFNVIKYGLKDVEGLKNPDGSDYKLKFDDDGILTDECVNELFLTEFEDHLTFAAVNIFNKNVPEKIVHPMTGQEIEGVEIIIDGTLKKK